MDNFKFIKQSFLNPRTVGAIMPSSIFSAKKMVAPIDFKQAKIIVEVGAGTGVFTEELVRQKRVDTTLIVIEINESFAKQLKEKYRTNHSVIVINNSAEYMNEYLLELGKVDYVISGIPFASIPRQLSTKILQNVSSLLKEKGQFITIQYTKRQFQFISSFFNSLHVERVYLNIPPAYIVICQK